MPALFLAGCGYIGEPLPPALNIPVPVSDLACVQRGGKIIVQFNGPKLTTEGLGLRQPPRLELRIGEWGDGAFDARAWAANARIVETTRDDKGHVLVETAAAPWAGKQVFLGVKAFGPGNRDGGWSNMVALHVLAPLSTPSGLRTEVTSGGVKLTWSSSSPQYRVFRRTEPEENLTLVATVDAAEWLDTATQYLKKYVYAVQAVQKAGDSLAESELSASAGVTPVDEFPPAIPAGLSAVAGTESIELSWDPNAEPDLAGYRVYRALEDGKMVRIGETKEQSSYSDRKLQSGKQYRYAVSAVDAVGNESKMSTPAEAVAP